jgi:dTDP-4-dehydrorhamnose 3,5-epimerase-like enzyme
LGFISVAETKKGVPFEIKRVYWTYYTPESVIRGGHAHKKLHQVILAVSGIIKFKIEHTDGSTFEFILNKPDEGLYLPPFTWREMQFSHNAVLICLASELFDENDYIRDYSAFKNRT